MEDRSGQFFQARLHSHYGRLLDQRLHIHVGEKVACVAGARKEKGNRARASFLFLAPATQANAVVIGEPDVTAP